MIPFHWQTVVHNETAQEFQKRYNTHFQRSEYVKYKVDSDIKIGKELQDAIRKTSESQNKVIINSTNEIIGSLEKNLDSINRAIIDSSSEIRSELKRGNELQRIENIINSNIAELLKIPDSRKELQALIEEGFQHYSNAFHEEEDPDFLLEAALVKFLQAEKIKNDEYIVLNIIGKIYLNSPKLIDLQKAEDYLVRAAKFANSQTADEADRIINILKNDVDKDISEIKVDVNLIKKIAAESYYLASVSCFLQKKYDAAADYAKRAFEIINTYYQAGYSYAKFLLLSGGDNSQIADILEIVVRGDRSFLALILQDGNFVQNNVIDERLANLKEIILDELNKKLAFLKKNMIEQSRANDKILEYENQLSLSEDLLSRLEILYNIEYKKFEIPENEHYTEGSSGWIDVEYRDYSVVDIINEEKRIMKEAGDWLKTLTNYMLPDSEAIEIITDLNKKELKTINQVKELYRLLGKNRHWHLYQEIFYKGRGGYNSDKRRYSEIRENEIKSNLSLNILWENLYRFKMDLFNIKYDRFENISKAIKDEIKIGEYFNLIEFIEMEAKLRDELNYLTREDRKLKEDNEQQKLLEVKKQEESLDALKGCFKLLFLWPFYLIVYILKLFKLLK